MQERLFMFGAGASKSYTGSKTSVTPPLAANFFRIFQQLDVADDPLFLVGYIVNYIRDTRGIHPFEFGDWNENVEELLTEIEAGIRQSIKDKNRPSIVFHTATYNQLIFFFAALLNEIQNGQICANYSKFVTNSPVGDVIITFNWDTLLDRALFDSQRWFPDDGYAINFDAIYYDKWVKPNSEANQSKYKLLKLHGSTNWLIPIFTYDLNTGERVFARQEITSHNCPVFCYIDSTLPYKTYRNRARNGYGPFSYYYYPPNLPLKPSNTSDRKQYSADIYGGIEESHDYSMPLIIPPLKEKPYESFNTIFPKLWQRADEIALHVSEIILIGYSLPSTDTRPYELMSKALKKGNLNKITVVNPYPEDIVARLKQHLSTHIQVESITTTFDKYAASEFYL